METRFKIVALLILSSNIYSCLEDKIEIVADAIDVNAPMAEDMLRYLENSVLKINDYVTEQSLN